MADWGRKGARRHVFELPWASNWMVSVSAPGQFFASYFAVVGYVMS
jgi:hypothetical protein